MRSSKTITVLAVVCLNCLILGCAGDTAVETASSEGDAESAASTGGPSIPSSMLPGIPGAGGATTGEQPPVPNYPDVQPSASTPPAFDPNLPEAGGERVRAEVGVAKQGQATKDVKGIGAMIVQPARSLFAVKQRVVFDVQIPKFMQLFEASEGRKPNSNDEFMNKIIKANYVKLPELPAGETYVYDPELGELMVQKPGG